MDLVPRESKYCSKGKDGKGKGKDKGKKGKVKTKGKVSQVEQQQASQPQDAGQAQQQGAVQQIRAAEADCRWCMAIRYTGERDSRSDFGIIRDKHLSHFLCDHASLLFEEASSRHHV